jgi:hypothetical protein
MWAVIIYSIWRGWGWYIRSKRQKKISIKAKIKNKQGKQEFNPVHWNVEYTQKVLIFECDDGIERHYEVHDSVWDWVEVGDDGTLTYQGDLFVDFDARRPRHNLDELYKRYTRT